MQRLACESCSITSNMKALGGDLEGECAISTREWEAAQSQVRRSAWLFWRRVHSKLGLSESAYLP
ncbi:hypothetical protein BD309DRAFT_966125 [Dichomitus squalens]|nr:hypothetical protein BD309DRAFT_966125 [Dichomitus squalens]